MHELTGQRKINNGNYLFVEITKNKWNTKNKQINTTKQINKQTTRVCVTNTRQSAIVECLSARMSNDWINHSLNHALRKKVLNWCITLLVR